jgi:hypothetical protein
LSMIPTPGSAICPSNVYVVQATVSISWLFRLIFLFFLVWDLVIVTVLCVAVLRLKIQIKFPMTLELFREITRMPHEFCEQIQAGGNLDRYMRCTFRMSTQMLSDSLEMNAFTSSFGEFYHLLNEIELFDSKDIVEIMGMYKSTAFGNETGTFEMIVHGGKTRTFSKHWKSAVSRMPAKNVLYSFCVIAKIMVDVVYPSILLSTSPCASYQQIYSIFVIIKSVITLLNNVFKAFKNTCCLNKQLQEE